MKCGHSPPNVGDSPHEPAGPPQGECRSAQHGGYLMSPPGRPKANTVVHSTEVA